MIEQTKGYLRVSGKLFGLNDWHSIYESEYTKRLKFTLKTNTLNSIMVSSKYWFEGNALEVSIKGKDDKYSSRLKKEDVQLKLLKTFNNGESVDIKCIIDPNIYLDKVYFDMQLLSISSIPDISFDSNSFKEHNSFIQTFVFDSIQEDCVKVKLIDYRERISDFDKFKISDNLIETFSNFEFGDLLKCSGSVNNVPVIIDNMFVGKEFYMRIDKVMSCEKGKYSKEDLVNKKEEELITDDSLMPWED